MIDASVLDERPFSGPEAFIAAGYRGFRDHGGKGLSGRYGPYIGLEPIGSGGRYRVSVRQVAVLSVVHDVIDPLRSGHGGGYCAALARRIADALMQTDDWSEYLIVSDGEHCWASSPTQVMALTCGRSVTTIVPLRPYLERVLAGREENPEVTLPASGFSSGLTGPTYSGEAR